MKSDISRGRRVNRLLPRMKSTRRYCSNRFLFGLLQGGSVLAEDVVEGLSFSRVPHFELAVVDGPQLSGSVCHKGLVVTHL